jgi:endonuclease YncB( thermonuclease family)
MLLTGKVVEVNDGNTITLLAGKELYEIRLAGIDAPERDQPAGPAALEALSHKVLDKTVRVLSLDNGHLKKFRGVVYFNGCVNTEMVREGMAWYDPQSGQSLWLADAERQARQARQGVWAETNPTPPWEWLRAKAAKDQPPPADPPAKPAPSKRSRVARKAGESPIASDQATAPGNAASPPAPSAAAKPAAAPGQWWLTEGTNTRHNPTCRRYYMKTKGRFCGPDEGQPCRLCGG